MPKKIHVPIRRRKGNALGLPPDGHPRTRSSKPARTDNCAECRQFATEQDPKNNRAEMQGIVGVKVNDIGAKKFDVPAPVDHRAKVQIGVNDHVQLGPSHPAHRHTAAAPGIAERTTRAHVSMRNQIAHETRRRPFNGEQAPHLRNTKGY